MFDNNRDTTLMADLNNTMHSDMVKIKGKQFKS